MRGGRNFDRLIIHGSQIVLEGKFSMSGDGMSELSGMGEVAYEIHDGKLIEIEGGWKRKKTQQGELGSVPSPENPHVR